MTLLSATVWVFMLQSVTSNPDSQYNYPFLFQLLGWSYVVLGVLGRSVLRKIDSSSLKLTISFVGMVAGSFFLLIDSGLLAFFILMASEFFMLGYLQDSVPDDPEIARSTKLVRIFLLSSIPAVVAGVVLMVSTGNMALLGVPICLTQSLACIFYLKSLALMRGALQERTLVREEEGYSL